MRKHMPLNLNYNLKYTTIIAITTITAAIDNITTNEFAPKLKP